MAAGWSSEGFLSDAPVIDVEGHYAALGILPTATAAVIKAVYRVRMMEIHPDRKLSESIGPTRS